MDSIFFMDTAALMLLIADRVKSLRKKRGLTQQELAVKADIGQMSVSNIEHAGGLGRTSVTIETANKIALALNIELWQLCLPPDSFLPGKEVVDLIIKYSKSSPEGRKDIQKIADLAAKYNPNSST